MKILRLIGLVVLALLVVLAGFIYLWPLQTHSLQTAHPASLTYDQAVERIQSLRQQDGQAGARAECRTGFYTHGQATARVVVMFHGVGECPQQFDAMGRSFYDQGYNVFIPRAPHFGLADNRQHGRVTAQELVGFADNAVTIGTGLGQEVSLIGLSGGGVLATWAAEYRPDAVSRVEVLSPFYAPSTSQVPLWQRRFLSVLYGYGLLPDGFNSPSPNALSYHALGQYLRIVDNLKSKPVNPKLRTVASVVSAGDNAIDHDLARRIPAHLATTNGLNLTLYNPPAEWHLGHDIAKAEPNADINGHSQDLYPIYLRLLEGRQ
jgi:pimeloyl-ACP methyl ester carboxylesterase